MASADSPCGHIAIGTDRIPIFNLKYTPQSPMQEVIPPPHVHLSTTEKQLRDFCAEHNLAYDTVLQVVAADSLDSISPAESLANLAAELNRGMVLISTKAKGKSRQARREGGARERRAMAGSSKKRTAKERQQVQSKLREWRRSGQNPRQSPQD